MKKISRGFTLIELLVVIAVIGLLASVIMVSLNSARLKARDAKRLQTLTQIETALDIYYNQYGDIPLLQAIRVRLHAADGMQQPTDRLFQHWQQKESCRR